MVSLSCCSCKSNQAKKSNLQNTECEAKVADNFLSDEKALDQLWLVFDPNNENVIEEKELENLVYKTLLHFISLKNPDIPAPILEDINPYVKELTATLHPFEENRDKDKKITKDEFQGYGVYLTAEFKKWMEETESKMKNGNGGELVNADDGEKTKLLAVEGNTPAPSAAVEA